MPDREKVIIVLNECKMKEPDVDFCIICPYETDANHMCFEFLLNDAIALLKEQEPVEPKVSSAEQRCGNCNKVIEMDGWKSCPWCGKPIAWSEWWNKNTDRR